MINANASVQLIFIATLLNKKRSIQPAAASVSISHLLIATIPLSSSTKPPVDAIADPLLVSKALNKTLKPAHADASLRLVNKEEYGVTANVDALSLLVRSQWCVINLKSGIQVSASVDALRI